MIHALIRSLSRQICLELFFFYFILILRKAYKRYISTSKDFYSSLGLSLLVDEIMKFRHISYALEIQTTYS